MRAAMINRLEKTAALPSDCYVYKHSTACPVSAAAAQVVESTDFDLPVFRVDVIEQRKLSDQVAKRYGVRHESPQLLKVEGGAATTVLSHHQIAPEQLARAING